ncbi:MAG: sensor histidine kinase [Anaerolineae bacterium]|nr:sensor histidine kinase [Anaerolineae bacterium]
MATTRELTSHLDVQALIDGMGQGILIFDPEGALIADNVGARRMLGPDMAHIRQAGWPACADLLNPGIPGGAPDLDALRERAAQSAQPVRFSTALNHVFIPGWISALHAQTGQALTQVTLENADWTALAQLMDRFRSEARQAIIATRGHAELLSQLSLNRPKGMTVDQFAGRVLGFSEIMTSHMYRLEILIELLQRWEIILTGQLEEEIKQRNRCIELTEWLEDYLEALLDQSLADPEIGLIDYRERLVINIPDDIYLSASPHHLGTILRDLLRNAVLYTFDNSPIILQAVSLAESGFVRIDVIDQGCGIREKELAKIFQPFQRAMQPQVISQFGYGLSLFLSKAEIEAMGGSIEFKSEEGVGSIFSLKVPAWVNEK